MKNWKKVHWKPLLVFFKGKIQIHCLRHYFPQGTGVFISLERPSTERKDVEHITCSIRMPPALCTGIESNSSLPSQGRKVIYNPCFICEWRFAVTGSLVEIISPKDGRRFNALQVIFLSLFNLQYTAWLVWQHPEVQGDKGTSMKTQT